VLATQNPVDLDYKGLANIGVWLVGKLQTAQDRDRLRDGLTGAGMAPAAVDALLDATGKRVFLLHDVHRPAPVLLESRWAMSYLRGPLTREEIGRLMADRVRATAAAARPPRRRGRPRPAGVGGARRPSGLAQSFLNHFGGERADPYLLVKYAVRYKGMDESVGCARGLSTPPRPRSCSTVTSCRRRGPALRSAAAGRRLRRASRLPERARRGALAGEGDQGPAARRAGGHGLDGSADQGDLAARRGPRGLRRAAGPDAAAAPVARLRDRLEQKKGELEARQRDLEGRRTEKWVALGSAVLSNIGLFTGRKRTISGAGTVVSKNRMEGTAEARVEALKAEIADLEQELAAHSTVDPQRLQSTTVVPTRTQVKLLRYGIVWVY
jgi:hypothetical protein